MHGCHPSCSILEGTHQLHKVCQEDDYELQDSLEGTSALVAMPWMRIVLSAEVQVRKVFGVLSFLTGGVGIAMEMEELGPWIPVVEHCVLHACF